MLPYCSPSRSARAAQAKSKFLVSTDGWSVSTKVEKLMLTRSVVLKAVGPGRMDGWMDGWMDGFYSPRHRTGCMRL